MTITVLLGHLDLRWNQVSVMPQSDELHVDYKPAKFPLCDHMIIPRLWEWGSFTVKVGYPLGTILVHVDEVLNKMGDTPISPIVSLLESGSGGRLVRSSSQRVLNRKFYAYNLDGLFS